MKCVSKSLIFFLFHCLTFSQQFEYSRVQPIPNLSFLPQVYTGLDVLEQLDCRPLADKSIAVLCNQASVNRNGKHILDILAEKKIDVRYILLPEHGIDRENVILRDGEEFEPLTGARFVDLFGRFVKPPNWVMRDVDLFLIDIQDTGVRYTTYMTTITKIMEAASEWEIPMIVLDRPNPLGGMTLEGPIPRIQYQSFKAYHLVPIRHGLTIGEYSIMINETGWVKKLGRVKLTVIPMANWTRTMWMDDVFEKWIPTEPRHHDLNTLLAYTGMELFTGTNLSNGQGTDHDYQWIGAPWISEEYYADHLNQLNLPGVHFRPIRFIPKPKKEDKYLPILSGMECGGVKLIITDKTHFEPVRTAAAMMITAHHLYPREFQWEENDYIETLFGSPLIRITAAQQKGADTVAQMWGHDILRFNKFRGRFLLYP